MGISSNQARFLALTSRQVDLEFRVQQICQRRLRLSSELENVATSYNNSISNRALYTMNTSNSGISSLTASNIKALTDTNGKNYTILGQDSSTKQYQSISSVGTAALFTAATGAVYAAAGATDATASVLKMGTTNYSLNALGLAAGASEADIMEAALRHGVISIATNADEFTQTTTYTGADTAATATYPGYEIKDWRTLPNIADELYKGDDTTAENKYDTTVSEINAQDKKLQLEQTSIEVEYKAVTSEKDAVKKILDTNATASFKYFS